MKTIKTLLTIALLSVIFCGCSKKSTTPPHLIAVPKSAFLVAAFDAKQTVNKAGLNKMEQFKFYSFFEKEIQNLPAAQAKAVKEFLKNTRTSGLNLDKIFFYFTGNTEENFSFGVTFQIDNLKTFEKFLDENNLSSQAEDNKIILPNVNMSLQWNDKILVLSLNSEDINVLNSDENESILANEIFKTEYQKSKNDACLFFEFNGFITLVEQFQQYTSEMQDLSSLEQCKDFSCFISYTTEKGSFVCTAKLFPTEKVNELYGTFYKQDFDNNIYKYFPEKSLVALKIAIKPLDAYNQYKKNIGIGADENEAETTTEKVEILDEKGNVTETEEVEIDSYNGHNYNYMLKYYIEQNDAQITSILSSFTGDLLVSFVGLNEQMQPEYAVAAGIAEGKENDVLDLIQKAGFTKKDDYYTLNTGAGVNVYFAINNNIAYLAGSPEYVAKLFDKGYSSDITSAKEFGKDLKNSLLYFYWNININDYPAMLKMLVNTSEEGRMVMPLLEKLKSLTIKSDSASESEFRINLTDNGDYATKTILKAIDDMVSKYLDLQ